MPGYGYTAGLDSDNDGPTALEPHDDPEPLEVVDVGLRSQQADSGPVAESGSRGEARVDLGGQLAPIRSCLVGVAQRGSGFGPVAVTSRCGIQSSTWWNPSSN